MKKTTRFINKNILIVGLAMSGYHAALLLKKLGANVIVNDSKDLTSDEHAKILREKDIRVIDKHHPLELVTEHVDFLIKNPGISYTQEQISKAMSLNIPILTDVEVAYEIMDSLLIAVTGTNGKTTVTSMLVEVLNQNSDKRKAFAAGNIGIPATEVAQRASEKDIVVMETSSFQLMGIDTFRPNIAVITNIYSAHLDYHGTQEEYESAKMRIARNQHSDDFLIYNDDQEHLRELVSKTNATLVPFSRTRTVPEGAYLKDGWVWFKEDKIIAISEFPLKGNHNIENVLAVIAAAVLAGKTKASIVKGLKEFTGVKHRLEFVGEVEGVRFFNDSKATNPLATVQALSSFEEPVILLAGGLDRHNGFDEMESSLKEKVKTLILFGQTADQLEQVGKAAGVSQIKKCRNLKEAIRYAYSISDHKDVILLSPACASWDEYGNFEERGDEFIAEVEKIRKREKGDTAE